MATTTLPISAARLDVSADQLRAKYDREIFPFAHNLHELDVFSPEALLALADAYGASSGDHFVACSAPKPDSVFFKVPSRPYSPRQAMERMDAEPLRLLLKRPENHDPRFRALRDQLFNQVQSLRGGLGNERIERLESAVFVTSAASTTPFHFDPEIAFFTQIRGEKIYHVYPAATLAEPELEQFFLQGLVSIGQIDLVGRDSAREIVYRLKPGAGFHQPQNSPHWVETGSELSVSYSFVFETNLSRAQGRTRACNYYERKLGIEPAPLGEHAAVDALKAATMRAVIPVRQRVGRVTRRLRGSR